MTCPSPDLVLVGRRDRRRFEPVCAAWRARAKLLKRWTINRSAYGHVWAIYGLRAVVEERLTAGEFRAGHDGPANYGRETCELSSGRWLSFRRRCRPTTVRHSTRTMMMTMMRASAPLRCERFVSRGAATS